jgi:hypothetical protein
MRRTYGRPVIGLTKVIRSLPYAFRHAWKMRDKIAAAGKQLWLIRSVSQHRGGSQRLFAGDSQFQRPSDGYEYLVVTANYFCGTKGILPINEIRCHVSVPTTRARPVIYNTAIVYSSPPTSHNLRGQPISTDNPLAT